MPPYVAYLLADVAEGLLGDASYIWVIIFLILTGCGLPIPEEVGIIAAGVWAADGAMNFWLGLGACLIGCIIGDSIMYYIGYRFGKSILREHPAFTGFLTPEREKKDRGIDTPQGLDGAVYLAIYAGSSRTDVSHRWNPSLPLPPVFTHRPGVCHHRGHAILWPRLVLWSGYPRVDSQSRKRTHDCAGGGFDRRRTFVLAAPASVEGCARITRFPGWDGS